MIIPAWLGVTWNVMTRCPLTGIVPPRLQFHPCWPTLTHTPWWMMTERYVTLEGSVSETSTLVAGEGPLLVTVSV